MSTVSISVIRRREMALTKGILNVPFNIVPH